MSGLDSDNTQDRGMKSPNKRFEEERISRNAALQTPLKNKMEREKNG